MEQDTRDFITALCTPFEVKETVMKQLPDRPKPEPVEITATVQVTLKVVKLEEKNIYWKK
jgi:hypothetical protein